MAHAVGVLTALFLLSASALVFHSCFQSLQFWGMVNMLAIPKFFRQKNPQYEMPV
jgi:hypothetical protein